MLRMRLGAILVAVALGACTKNEKDSQDESIKGAANPSDVVEAKPSNEVEGIGGYLVDPYSLAIDESVEGRISVRAAAGALRSTAGGAEQVKVTLLALRDAGIESLYDAADESSGEIAGERLAQASGRADGSFVLDFAGEVPAVIAVTARPTPPDAPVRFGGTVAVGPDTAFRDRRRAPVFKPFDPRITGWNWHARENVEIVDVVSNRSCVLDPGTILYDGLAEADVPEGAAAAAGLPFGGVPPRCDFERRNGFFYVRLENRFSQFEISEEGNGSDGRPFEGVKGP